MREYVEIRYHGGPWDGRIEHIDTGVFVPWEGKFPWGQFAIGSAIHLYESIAEFHLNDEIVDVHYSGIVDTGGDESSYDGFLPIEDQYHDREGSR